MKKALSLVLALVMVLSMAVVGFAADNYSITYAIDVVDPDVEVAGDEYTEITGVIDVTNDDVTDVYVTAWPEDEDVVENGSFNPLTGKFSVEFDTVYNVVYLNVLVEGTDVYEDNTYELKYAAPAVVNPAVKAALEEAAEKHTIEVVLDVADLETTKLTAADIAYITNSYKVLWGDARYLGFEVTVINGTTIFDLGLIDYTWTKAIDFAITDGGIDADDYNAIRKLTGDTKNPLVWGFSGDAVPAGTEIDMVIPQAWINYYGHKNLTLFAWTEAITATIDNGAEAGKVITMEDAKVLAETTLDVNTTVTQRIQFTTDTLYKTLVLSANGTPVEDGAAVEDNKDANPNTGANDIVNVAVVFAVVSLAAAGALVCKKSK